MEDIDLLEIARNAAGLAAGEIIRVRARGFRTEHKSDQSPVTEADHAAEAVIVQLLRQATPEIPVVAEEEIAAGHVPDAHTSYWVVDPLDGTREFAAGRDEFAVCIGLVRDGRPVLGAVAEPMRQIVYTGLVGMGAWKWKDDVRTPIRTRTVPAAGMAVVASRHNADDPRLAPFLAGHKVASVLNIGSALKFCRVAEGLADLYPRFGRTMEWDTAGPQAVVEAAGGVVLVAATSVTLAYGKPGWENPGFICLGRHIP